MVAHRGAHPWTALAAAIALVLWPAAQAAQVISDMKINGPTRLAKGVAF